MSDDRATRRKRTRSDRARMVRRNVGELDAYVRRLVAGFALAYAERNHRDRPVLALLAAALALDLALTARARWCWTNALLGIDTRGGTHFPLKFGTRFST